MRQSDSPCLSIIVPIYNVADYLNTCLLSISKQTYSDFEVIMIDDGSTDTCAEICKRWEQKDNRFHYFYQDNQGLGPARNAGIRLSKAERILFIDSDDWVDDTIVEKLLFESIKTDADITYGDFYVVFPDGTKKIESIRSLFHLLNVTKEERINYSFQRSVCGAVCKKKLWTDNELFMPDIIYEDTAVYGILLCYAKKIATVCDGLYFYRAQREGSLMQVGKKDYGNMLRALDYFLRGADRPDLKNRYSINFFRYCIRQLGMDFRNCEKNMQEDELINVKMDMERLLSCYFPNWRAFPISGFMALGSFTSCDVYNRLVLYRDSRRENYSFTTLESLMSDELPHDCHQFETNNTYRIEMVTKDLKKTWKKYLDDCRYVILDLLEERHDIIACGSCYFTMSEAFDEACRFYGDYRIIPRGGEECRQIWRESCNAFFEIMETKRKKVFVLELYLCEYKGLRGKESAFENMDKIKAVNKELQYYYQYIRDNFSNAMVIRMEPDACFSSVNYKFGCQPWHYNEIGLFRLGEQIWNLLI